MIGSRTTLVVLSVLSVGVLSQLAFAEDPAINQFVGRWKGVRSTISGKEYKPFPGAATRSVEWVFTKTSFQILVDGKVDREFEYRIDSSRQPWHFDFSYLGNDPELKTLFNKPTLGICRFVDGKMERCFVASSETRPIEFVSTTSNLATLVVLERTSGAKN